jgi:hypothetical protein
MVCDVSFYVLGWGTFARDFQSRYHQLCVMDDFVFGLELPNNPNIQNYP